uniref:Uncharacterized protein n=1 Tax=Avena sativa TaxID=4498 RepID=A0ACD5Z961_AVESA
MDQHAVNGHGDASKAEQQFWNSTTWSHGAKELWKNPRVTMIRIEVLVSLVACVLLFLAIFGSRRRRSRNWFLQKGVFVAYTVCFSLATYTLGSMQSSELKSSMYPIWAISLFMLHACTDTITAYSLDDNREGTRLQYQGLMYMAYTLLLLITVKTDYIRALGYMALIAYIRYLQRLSVCMLASLSWNLNKIVADSMYEGQNKGLFETMEDCNYLVDWPIRKSKFDAPTYATQLTADPEKDEVIDIAKIWRCKDKSLGPELKDACLSFSLFHLLRRRSFGFSCDEYKDRARNFVLEVLLSENKDGAIDYSRVFKVIEVELAFMYDFFFTKYAVIYYGSMGATIWSLITVIGISITAYITATAPLTISQGDSTVASTVTDDVAITLVILASTALLECIQLLFYWTGIWGRVSFVCQHIRESARSNIRASQNKKTSARRVSSCIMGSKEFLAKIGVCLSSCIMVLKEFLVNVGVPCASNNHYWQHKLGQYSLLDSISCYNRNLSLRGFAYRIFTARPMVIVMKFVYLADHVFNHPRNVQALMVRKCVGKSVELSDEVKEAVIRSLKRTGGTLSNGKSLLQSNRAHELSWACTWEMHSDRSWSQRNQNQTHIILTWHIATWYCEMAKLSSEGVAAKLKVPFSIATTLSKYCAYLVVSAPRLLPGHPYDTTQKFDATAAEANTFFLKRGTNIREYSAQKDMYEYMKTSETPPQQTKTIFESGLKLGKELEKMEESTRWQVMVDFWAEMMLYLAPSANVEKHIERLAQGGEFITHLWALLSHAGILNREQEDEAAGV